MGVQSLRNMEDLAKVRMVFTALVLETACSHGSLCSVLSKELDSTTHKQLGRAGREEGCGREVSIWADVLNSLPRLRCGGPDIAATPGMSSVWL